MCVCVCLSLSSAAGGEIFDHCVSEELLPEFQITRLIRQTLEGVNQLHQSNLVHLDLKVGAHRETSCVRTQSLTSPQTTSFFFNVTSVKTSQR